MAAILGGGLGGLATGYYLLRNNVHMHMKLFLLEATPSCGGWIKTIRSPDYVFEQGPRTIRPKGDNALHTLNMLAELGLSEHVSPIDREHPAAKNRMILVNNQLHKLPSSLGGIFLTNKPFTKPLIYALFKDLLQPHKTLSDDTIYNFVERRFGKELADYGVSPMICGICAGDAKEISVKFLLKSLFEYEQNHDGVVRGMLRSMIRAPKDTFNFPLSDLALRSKDEKWSVYSLKGGLEVLPTTLKNYLIDNRVDLHFNQSVDEIVFESRSNVRIKTNSKSTSKSEFNANYLYSGVPAHRLAKLVKAQHPELANELAQIPFVDVGLVNLYFEHNHITQPGFGFLVPPIEKSKILGVVFDSCCLPDQKGTVLTVMIGGKWFQERLGENPTEQAILDIALEAVRSSLKINSTPMAYNVSILHKCIPQYIVGHHDRVERIRKYISDRGLPISLVGNSYDGVSVNDVVASAKVQVEKDNFTW